MRKIISSKPALIIGLYTIILFIGLSLTVLGGVVSGKIEESGAGLLVFGFFVCLSCFLLWHLNRAACLIWVENGVVKRKGLICGFYRECPVNAIRKIKIEYSRHEVGFGTFIYLVDDSAPQFHRFLRLRKDSYICFRKTKKNLAFLRTFWTGTIET